MDTWLDLARCPNDKLGLLDIAEVNLICAHGLPGAEALSISTCLSALGEMADKVRWRIMRNSRQFERKAWGFNYSRNYFRMLTLATVLQRDCGVRYNMAKIAEDVPFDTADMFIFGILQGNGGTCATLPVVYIALGRRLGYPLKLVKAAGSRYTHLFVRWDDANGDRFNVEATGEGLSSHPDKYYRTGRYKVSKKLEESACLLKSMSPVEELAEFINERGWHWLDLQEHRKAVECFAWASALMPGDHSGRTSSRSSTLGFRGLTVPKSLKTLACQCRRSRLACSVRTTTMLIGTT